MLILRIILVPHLSPFTQLPSAVLRWLRLEMAFFWPHVITWFFFSFFFFFSMKFLCIDKWKNTPLPPLLAGFWTGMYVCIYSTCIVLYIVYNNTVVQIILVPLTLVWKSPGASLTAFLFLSVNSSSHPFFFFFLFSFNYLFVYVLYSTIHERYSSTIQSVPVGTDWWRRWWRCSTQIELSKLMFDYIYNCN